MRRSFARARARERERERESSACTLVEIICENEKENEKLHRRKFTIAPYIAFNRIGALKDA